MPLAGFLVQSSASSTSINSTAGRNSLGGYLIFSSSFLEVVLVLSLAIEWPVELFFPEEVPATKCIIPGFSNISKHDLNKGQV